MTRSSCLFLLFCVASTAVIPGRGAAQEKGALFVRGALGGGYGGIGSEVADDHTNSVGYALAWDGALGAFVHRAIALHVSAFGHFQPNSVTAHDQAPRGRGASYLQNVGAGFTLAPARDLRRVPRLRPFLSGSMGVSIVNDHKFLKNAAGFGGQLMVGFEVRVNAGLRIGLALQGSYSGRRVRAESPPGRERPIDAGHIAGLLTVAYDMRGR